MYLFLLGRDKTLSKLEIAVYLHKHNISYSVIVNSEKYLILDFNKEHNFEKVSNLILKVCSVKSMTSDEIAQIFNKREDYMRRKYLKKLIAEKKLNYLYPEMINHPEQAYLTNNRK